MSTIAHSPATVSGTRRLLPAIQRPGERIEGEAAQPRQALAVILAWHRLDPHDQVQVGTVERDALPFGVVERDLPASVAGAAQERGVLLDVMEQPKRHEGPDRVAPERPLGADQR